MTPDLADYNDWAVLATMLMFFLAIIFMLLQSVLKNQKTQVNMQINHDREQRDADRETYRQSIADLVGSIKPLTSRLDTLSSKNDILLSEIRQIMTRIQIIERLIEQSRKDIKQ